MFKFLRKTLLTVLFAAFASQASAMFIQADWFDPTQPGVGTNRYAYSFNDPINLIDPKGNDAIEVAFPEYDIHVDEKVVEGVGHAGVVVINNETGETRYFEYGRYDEENIGIVRTRSIPDVKIGSNGLPTEDSLTKVLESISRQAGQGGIVMGKYDASADDYEAMIGYAEEQMKSNSDPDRKPYGLMYNNCSTFAQSVVIMGNGSIIRALDALVPNTFPDAPLASMKNLDFTYNPRSNEFYSFMGLE